VIKFEDVFPGHNGGGYTVTNEQPLVFGEMLKDVSISRCAGICSGGEVGLMSLLPLTKRELVLVDHAYSAIAAAMMKVLLLHRFGLTRGLEMFRGSPISPSEFETLKQLQYDLPEVVRAGAYNGGQIWYDYASPGYYRRSALSQGVTAIIMPAMQEPWKKVTAEQLEKAWNKLDKITFIHGDMTDLIKKRKPFDAFYMSNAYEHDDRFRKSKDPNRILEIVKPGGNIVGTRSSSRDLVLSQKPVEERRSGAGDSWLYFNVKTPSRR